MCTYTLYVCVCVYNVYMHTFHFYFIQDSCNRFSLIVHGVFLSNLVAFLPPLLISYLWTGEGYMIQWDIGSNIFSQFTEKKELTQKND